MAPSVSSAVPLPGAPALRELAPGAVRPLGWLRDQLGLQARGLTGRLGDIWPDVGPDSGWLGGSGESWERGPYYLDGLVPLAHALQDPALLAKAQEWVEAILASGRPDGWFGPANDDWWPRIVALKALIQHADATGDDRVLPFIERYLRYQAEHLPGRPFSSWARIRGSDELVAVAWCYERTGEPWLLDVARILIDQTTDWDRYFRVFPFREVTTRPHHLTHVVNVAMGVKSPATRYLVDGDPAHREALEAGLAQLDEHHGLVHGMFSGDEHLAGTEATRGVELCAVVEMLYSLQTLLRAWGSRDHADRLERIAYNALPAAMTADVTAHQYHQQGTQVLVSIAHRDWTAARDDCQTFGLEPNFGCCTANLHQGWPKLLRAMWYTTPDGGLAAVVHGPSAVTWDGRSGAVEIEATTTYPFGETIRYEVRAGGGRFPLSLRIPAWCEDPSLVVAGAPVEASVEDGFVRIDREWRTGDVVELTLPAVPRLLHRPSGGAGVALGSLLLVQPAVEVWERFGGIEEFGEWEVRSRGLGPVAISADEAKIGASVVERREPGELPFGHQHVEGVPRNAAAVEVTIPAAPWEGWSLIDNSLSPVSSAVVTSTTTFPWYTTFVPYGAARIRVAEFPLVHESDPAPRTLYYDVHGEPDGDDGFADWPIREPDRPVA